MHTSEYLSYTVVQLDAAWSVTTANVHMVDVCLLGVA